MANVKLVCSDFRPNRGKCREWVEDNSFTAQDFLKADDPVVSELISSIALLFAIAFSFNFCIKFLLNKL